MISSCFPCELSDRPPRGGEVHFRMVVIRVARRQKPFERHLRSKVRSKSIPLRVFRKQPANLLHEFFGHLALFYKAICATSQTLVPKRITVQFCKDKNAQFRK